MQVKWGEGVNVCKSDGRKGLMYVSPMGGRGPLSLGVMITLIIGNFEAPMGY